MMQFGKCTIMINKLYFKSHKEFIISSTKYNATEYSLGVSYIISAPFAGKEEIYYAIGERHIAGLITPMLYHKEEWFELLSQEDKQEAIWMMHD